MSVYGETPPSGVPGEDLYPEDEEEQRKILSWVTNAFLTAKADKSAYEEKWDKYYKMYRSHLKKRPPGDWRSNVWIPISFFIIETLAPRLVGQLPEFTVEGVGPEDAMPAEQMEMLLKWAADKGDLHVELVKALKSALLYGTGILKISYCEKTGSAIVRQPELQPTTMQVPTGEFDLDGNPIMEEVPGEPVPTGRMIAVRQEFLAYAGPTAEAVDIKDFFVDPFADSIETARYVIHRVWRSREYLEQQFERGIYKKPPEEVWQTVLEDHSMKSRQAIVGLGSESATIGVDRQMFLIPILEVWTDDTVTTAVGGEMGALALLRHERNPYAHQEKPFVRIVDHLVPHEFWGIGELEPIEALQDLLNSIWNTRIDNLKLTINTMLMAVMDYVVDPSELQVYPGKVIRLREGLQLNQVIAPLTLPNVTDKAYQEVAEVEREIEKATGVSPYQVGLESPAYNRTASGIALMTEQGNTRFSLKVRLAELTGFRRLARQFGAILQQFLPEELVVRIMGPNGQIFWQTVTPDSIQGRFDYDIEAQSSTQVESVRKEQRMSLFQMLAMDPFVKPFQIRADLLKVFGIKNVQDYIFTPEELQMMQQQQAAAMEGEEVPEGAPA